jgi:hypothetical protein
LASSFWNFFSLVPQLFAGHHRLRVFTTDDSSASAENASGVMLFFVSAAILARIPTALSMNLIHRWYQSPHLVP